MTVCLKKKKTKSLISEERAFSLEQIEQHPVPKEPHFLLWRVTQPASRLANLDAKSS